MVFRFDVDDPLLDHDRVSATLGRAGSPLPVAFGTTAFELITTARTE
jgi:hypothetical protein